MAVYFIMYCMHYAMGNGHNFSECNFWNDTLINYTAEHKYVCLDKALSLRPLAKLQSGSQNGSSVTVEFFCADASGARVTE